MQVTVAMKALKCWCLGGAGPNCMGLSIYYTAYMTAATHIYTGILGWDMPVTGQQFSSSFVYSSRAVGIGYMYTEDLAVQWAREKIAKAAKLWHICSRDFTRVAIYLVVQLDLSKWKTVHCLFTGLQLADNCRQGGQSHAITREQRLNSNIWV